MKASQFLLLPNLLSLSRILLTPIVGYLLAQPGLESVYLCVGVLIVAVATDALDGYTARRLNQQSQLGLYLDPVADKLFAAVLLVLLVIYRELPIWLAGVVVGRDLLILVTGLLAVRKRNIALPSNLTGQYAFFAIVFLLGFYIIRFPFGQQLATWTVVALTAASSFNYGRRFLRIMRGQPAPIFQDRPAFRWMRIGAAALLIGLCTVMFVIEMMN
jgi:CDP-diacylglycerol--glycerol-3-phosphate 3-phosphatidyltransferase